MKVRGYTLTFRLKGLVFVAAILVWTVKNRRWKVLLGFAAGTSLLTLIPILVNPAVLAQYLAFVQNSPVQIWATATLAAPIRFIFGGDYFLLQFLPTLLGLVWFAWFWHRHHPDWDWPADSPLLFLVSMATAAYGWIFDHPVAYLALIQMSVLLSKTRPWRPGHWVIAAAYWALNIYVILVIRPQHELWWVSSVLLLLYLSLLRITPPIQRSAAA